MIIERYKIYSETHPYMSYMATDVDDAIDHYYEDFGQEAVDSITEIWCYGYGAPYQVTKF